MRQEMVRRQNVGDDCPRLRKGQGMASSPLAFALDESVRDRRQRDMAVPALERTPFELVEAEFVLQFRYCGSIAHR